jgi:hypothetical protein
MKWFILTFLLLVSCITCNPCNPYQIREFRFRGVPTMCTIPWYVKPIDKKCISGYAICNNKHVITYEGKFSCHWSSHVFVDAKTGKTSWVSGDCTLTLDYKPTIE